MEDFRKILGKILGTFENVGRDLNTGESHNTSELYA